MNTIDKYIIDYSSVLKYGMTTTLSSMIDALLHKPEQQNPHHTLRLIAADAADEADESELANLLRSDKHIIYHNNTFVPAIHKWRDVTFHQGGDENELMHMIGEQGPGPVLKHILRTYDTGEGHLAHMPAHGNMDGVYTEGNHVLSWNPSYPYLGVQEKIKLPESEYKADHQLAPGRYLHDVQRH